MMPEVIPFGSQTENYHMFQLVLLYEVTHQFIKILCPKDQLYVNYTIKLSLYYRAILLPHI